MIINKRCEWCKKEFNIPYKRRSQRFCSLSCNSYYGNRNRPNKIDATCKNCHKIFKIWPAKLAQGRGIHCSRKCYGESMEKGLYTHSMSEESRINLSKKRIGKLNPAYIHGNSDGAKRYKGMFSHLLKEKILERDGYICKECLTNIDLIVHHIDHNPLNNNLINLITWCRSCHTKHHSLERWEALMLSNY